MGGLAAAIGIARGGAEVTLLEAAHELGEIGAGIQVRGFQAHQALCLATRFFQTSPASLFDGE